MPGLCAGPPVVDGGEINGANVHQASACQGLSAQAHRVDKAVVGVGQPAVGVEFADDGGFVHRPFVLDQRVHQGVNALPKLSPQAGRRAVDDINGVANFQRRVITQACLGVDLPAQHGLLVAGQAVQVAQPALDKVVHQAQTKRHRHHREGDHFQHQIPKLRGNLVGIELQRELAVFATALLNVLLELGQLSPHQSDNPLRRIGGAALAGLQPATFAVLKSRIAQRRVGHHVGQCSLDGVVVTNDRAVAELPHRKVRHFLDALLAVADVADELVSGLPDDAGQGG